MIFDLISHYHSYKYNFKEKYLHPETVLKYEYTDNVIILSHVCFSLYTHNIKSRLGNLLLYLIQLRIYYSLIAKFMEGCRIIESRYPCCH